MKEELRLKSYCKYAVSAIILKCKYAVSAIILKCKYAVSAIISMCKYAVSAIISKCKYAVSAIIAMCDLQFYQVNKFDLQHDQGANILGSNETDFF